jgi:hypothetical protein
MLDAFKQTGRAVWHRFEATLQVIVLARRSDDRPILHGEPYPVERREVARSVASIPGESPESG